MRVSVYPEECPTGLFGLVSDEIGANNPREKKLRPPESEYSVSEGYTRANFLSTAQFPTFDILKAVESHKTFKGRWIIDKQDKT